ncbi:hypothetical protein J6590_062027 [Homalodisca vitripennis]|nr:hypothetical protein J6590_062027 [Homalodisca vitripennis]
MKGMEGLTFNEDEVINVDEYCSSSRFKTQVPEDVIAKAHIPTFEVQATKPAPVVCHFFFPSNEDGIDSLEREGDLQDPLASSDYPISDCQTEHITVDDELLALENLPATAKTSFSIIDPINIVGPNNYKIKIEPEIERPDIKPQSEQSRNDTTWPDTGWSQQNQQIPQPAAAKAATGIGLLPLNNSVEIN